MNYENQLCPCCGKPLKDGDDIVVCPVCATPQHRECWMQNGRCANDDRHASGFVWKRERVQEQREESGSRVCHICGSENPDDALHCGSCGALFGGQEQNADGPKRCAYCGKENDDDALHCKYCGAPLGISQGSVFGGSPYMQGTGFAPDEKIGENTAEDLSVYVQSSLKRYLPKFKRFAKGKKLSFNFAAFFFAPYWFFYRKMYKAGAFFLVAFVTVSMLLSGFSNQIAEVAYEYTEAINGMDITEETTEEELAAYEADLLVLINELSEKVKKPMLTVASVTIVLRLICALLADKLYYKKVVDDMKLINDSVREENLRKMMIARRGGLSALAFTASLLGENILISILVYAADLITLNF